RMVIAESLPGGTTTAFLVLRALGYNGMVSSASPVNPISLKERVWEEAARRLKIQNGEMEGRGRLAAMELGDPMQITVAGMIAGLTEDVDITLAGGTQMLAVAAVARQSGMSRPLRVATTRYVAEDRNAHFRELAKKIKVDTFEAQLNFSHSPFPGLADYEKGFVKEGVGAGGAVWYAEQLGVPVSRVIQKTESIYQDMMH
ncbi:MAG: nicotinate-nucleotide--dimethylbenzimidazole phosphoribosyltransferase, partial [Atribacterota bacterium]